ncbi:DUF58 domain-containing protein [Pseudoduganella ginsengisoli]|uniref:DUF58 domain-containing protein n=1 Tax=Pseudoduganella ginsengisoli TaxID=1462440 RepID=A0A6L6Q698_9BURK|nr:DUF58 domain-containing protein [Pseudoduganella ginsengisoli]MTW05105.1 DUF58 domain-containing protein [Pseudoduganella ginsengisoli]
MTPARKLLQWVLAWGGIGLVFSVLAAFAPALKSWLAMAFWPAGAALLAACVVDMWRGWPAPLLLVERQAQGVWPVGVWHNVAITLRNGGAQPLHVELFDDYPAGWDMEGLPHASTIAPGGFVTVTYRLRPQRRGDAHFGQPHVRVATPFGFWLRSHRLGPQLDVKVFPDFSRLLGQTLMATDRRAPAAGAIRRRRRGEGTDFRQLREYRQGDSLRAIDWKATARQRKPISREYQEERDQQVVFLLDCGRRMAAEDEGGTHFGHALQAVLTLGFVAQKQGDAVGLMSFGHEGPRWLSPHKGRAGFDRLLAGIYDLHPREQAPDYVQAAGALMRKLSKRAFVVLITNLRDEDDLAMRNACELLGTRHMVLCASLREQALDAAVAAEVGDFAQALRQSAAVHYLQQRRDAIHRLGLRASSLVDVAPVRLPGALLNRYLDIKESGQL